MMKNKILFLGMTVLILSLGLVFVGCETGGGGVKWRDEFCPNSQSGGKYGDWANEDYRFHFVNEDGKGYGTIGGDNIKLVSTDNKAAGQVSSFTVKKDVDSETRTTTIKYKLATADGNSFEVTEGVWETHDLKGIYTKQP